MDSELGPDDIVALNRLTTLARVLAGTAHAGHLGQPMTSPIRTEEVRDTPARRDGNTVVLDHELLTMNRAAGDFSAAQTALAAKFRLVRYAINDGR